MAFNLAQEMDGCYRLAIDPWQAECNKECTEKRTGQVKRTALPSDGSADSHIFHFNLSFGTITVTVF